MPPVVQEINSVPELLQAVHNTQRHFNNLPRPWYRGQGDSKWTLVPRVFRTCDSQDMAAAAQERESRLFTNFCLQARAIDGSCPQGNELHEWLPFACQHKLPTRLLDWTRSPLVATFFAVDDCPGEEASLWALDPGGLNRRQFEGNGIFAGDHPRVARMMHGVRDRELLEDKAMAALLPERSMRMAVQRTAFTIHTPMVDLRHLEGHEEFLVEFRIPAGEKKLLKVQLAMLGITRVTLYPDLDHLGEDLAENDDAQASH